MKPAIDVMLALAQSFAEVEAAEQHLVGCQRYLNASIEEALKVYYANDCPPVVLVKPNTYIHFVANYHDNDVHVMLKQDSGVVHASDLKPRAEECGRFAIKSLDRVSLGRFIGRQVGVREYLYTDNPQGARSWPSQDAAIEAANRMGVGEFEIVNIDADARRAEQ